MHTICVEAVLATLWGLTRFSLFHFSSYSFLLLSLIIFHPFLYFSFFLLPNLPVLPFFFPTYIPAFAIFLHPLCPLVHPFLISSSNFLSFFIPSCAYFLIPFCNFYLLPYFLSIFFPPSFHFCFFLLPSFLTFFFIFSYFLSFLTFFSFFLSYNHLNLL